MHTRTRQIYPRFPGTPSLGRFVRDDGVQRRGELILLLLWQHSHNPSEREGEVHLRDGQNALLQLGSRKQRDTLPAPRVCVSTRRPVPVRIPRLLP